MLRLLARTPPMDGLADDRPSARVVSVTLATCLAVAALAQTEQPAPAPAGSARTQTPPAAQEPAPAQPTYQLDDSGAWVQTGTPEPGSDAAVMAEARRLIIEKRTSAAITMLDAWVTNNRRSNNPYVPEALLLRGDAKVAADNEYLALVDYEATTVYPESPHYVTALEREYQIALRYLNGLRRKFLGFRVEDARPTGEELLVRIQERLPGSRLAEQAAIELADYYFRRRDMQMASEMYEIFTRNFPQSEYRRWAMQRRIYASLARYKGPRNDTTGLIDAQNLIGDFRQEYPQDAETAGINDALESRIDDSLGDNMLQTAVYYLRIGDEPSARYTLRRLIRAHPRTTAAGQALRVLQEHGWDSGMQAAPAAPLPEASTPPDTPPAVSTPPPPGTPASTPPGGQP